MLANFHAALYGFDQVKVSYIFFFLFCLLYLLLPLWGQVVILIAILWETRTWDHCDSKITQQLQGASPLCPALPVFPISVGQEERYGSKTNICAIQQRRAQVCLQRWKEYLLHQL